MKAKLNLKKGLYLLFISGFTAACDIYFQGGNNGAAAIMAKALVYFALYYGFFFVMEKCLYYCHHHTGSSNWYQLLVYNKKNVLRLSLLFFAVYFFYLLIFYPGVTSGDTMYQLEDLVTGISPMAYPSTYSNRTVSALMIDSNPVATTLIFTLFYKIGILAGNANYGLFLYNFLQCGCLSILFATIICYMDHLHVPKPFAVVSIIFCISPVIASFAIFMGKDMLFSLCFILYNHVFAWMILNPQEQGGSRKQWLLLISLSILISLMNKKGMYLALFSNLCLIFVVSGKKKFLALPAAALPFFVVAVLIQQLIFPALNIYPGGKQEVLGVAFQQTSLSLIEHPEHYSEEEKTLFFSLLDLSQDELKEIYNPEITDPIKNRFPYDTGKEEVQAYLRMWAAHFPQEFITYIRATLSISGGYFTPHKAFNVYQYTPYSEALQAFSQPGQLTFLRESFGALIYWLENIPILSVFSQDSFYVFWIPAFALYYFFKLRERRTIVLLAPYAANILFLLFAPVCITRYGLCQLLSFPMLLTIIAQPTEDNEKSSV